MKRPKSGLWKLATWLLVGGVGVTQLEADEGMYPMSELGRIDLAAHGIRLTADELFNPDAVSLVDGICRVNGCTGSFVSADGLIITNHHCAYDAIQKASTPENDLLANGFHAGSREREIPAPDYQVRITESYRDVSAEVLAAVAPAAGQAALSGLDRAKAIERRRKELELAAEQEHPGLRAEVAEMFAGKTYVLFLYTWLKDVRLVFAPPSSIGNFGGEADNWEWPRHTGDFSFMRVYTAPDGSAATFNAANVPYHPKRVIAVNPAGVAENDAVFLLGYPGRTVRHRTASFLQYERDVRLPMVVAYNQWQIAVMEAAGAEDREVAIRHSSRIKSLANVEKRSRGQLQGLRRASIVEKKQAEEAALAEWLASDPAKRSEYLGILIEIEAVYHDMAMAAPLELNLDQLRNACRAGAFGWFLVDAWNERQKPDLERESPYMDRNFAQSRQALEVAMADWHGPTDEIMLAGVLDRLAKIPEASQIGRLKDILANPESIPEKAAALVRSTRLGDPAFLNECLALDDAAMQQVNDPLLKLVRALAAKWNELRALDKKREGLLGQLYGRLIELKQEAQSGSFVPDANSTLRMTFGRVRAYSPADGIIKTPITTLDGVIEKTTGIDPFITPQGVIDQFQQRNFGAFALADSGRLPVAILYDTDTTGGNSGSPVLDGDGKLVGVNFDRCFEATINDFAWNDAYSRSIGVDIRYVLWVTGMVYGASDLLAEMGVSTAAGENPK